MKINLKLNNLDCASCATKIEEKISKLNNVEDVFLSFALGKLTIICAEENSEKILSESSKIINDLEPDVVIEKI